MSELIKHCPFCGGRPILRPYAEPYGGTAWCIKCDGCTIVVDMQNKYDIIKAWNRRPEKKSLGEMVQSLVSMRDECTECYYLTKDESHPRYRCAVKGHCPAMDEYWQRSWYEDFEHENGNYERECLTCKEMFRGHKRRITCRSCYNNIG